MDFISLEREVKNLNFRHLRGSWNMDCFRGKFGMPADLLDLVSEEILEPGGRV